MCSYCGCRSITVIAELTREHEEVVNVLGTLVRAAARDDSAEVATTAARLAELLEPHTRTEELGLFAELRREPELADHVDDLCREHQEIDALVAAVARGDLADARHLDDVLRRHIDREENGLFPAAVIALDGPAWDRVVAAPSV